MFDGMQVVRNAAEVKSLLKGRAINTTNFPSTLHFLVSSDGQHMLCPCCAEYQMRDRAKANLKHLQACLARCGAAMEPALVQALTNALQHETKRAEQTSLGTASSFACVPCNAYMVHISMHKYDALQVHLYAQLTGSAYYLHTRDGWSCVCPAHQACLIAMC